VQFFEKKDQFDVYDIMGDFHLTLKSNGLSPATIAGKLGTVKTFLEFNGIPISNTIFHPRVRIPRRTRNIEL